METVCYDRPMENTSQSMTRALTEGLTDGIFKKLTPDRGGEVTSAEWERDVKDDLNTQYRAVYTDGTTRAERYTSV